MRVYIIPEENVDGLYDDLIKNVSSEEDSIFKHDMMFSAYDDVEEAKRDARIGDCLAIMYNKKLIPFQVLHKFEENGELRCILGSYYLLENHEFDEKTNVWRDCSLRKYLNGEFTKTLDPEFVKLVKPYKVHTDDYVTEDKFWIPSHEEVGYDDNSKFFKENSGTFVFDYYKENAENVRRATNVGA